MFTEQGSKDWISLLQVSTFVSLLRLYFFFWDFFFFLQKVLFSFFRFFFVYKTLFQPLPSYPPPPPGPHRHVFMHQRDPCSRCNVLHRFGPSSLEVHRLGVRGGMESVSKNETLTAISSRCPSFVSVPCLTSSSSLESTTGPANATTIANNQIADPASYINQLMLTLDNLPAGVRGVFCCIKANWLVVTIPCLLH